MEEVWKDIKDYKGKYQISNFGKVKSLSKLYGKNSKLLKQGNDRVGYLTVVLYDKQNKIRVNRTQRPHRLVAEAFIPNPLNKCCINHKDGVKTNNHISNLEWCTYKENSQHALRNGLLKPFTKEVIMFSLDGIPLLVFDSIINAMRNLNIPNSNISACCSGKFMQSNGYIWRHYHKELREEIIKEVEEMVEKRDFKKEFLFKYVSLTNKQIKMIKKIVNKEEILSKI